MRTRTVYTALGLALLGAWMPEAAAQELYLNLRPGVIRHEGEWTVGARWEAGLAPGQTSIPTLSFPRTWTYDVQGRGTFAGREASNPEPFIDAEADVGLQIQLLRLLPCLPEDCPDDLTAFDLGYVSLGLRGGVQIDQGAEEGIAGLGGAVMYRPLGKQNGVWPLVPTVSIGYTADWPILSELRDALDVDREVFGRLDLEAIWHVLFAREAVPAWLQPGRFDATLTHYRQQGLDDRVEDLFGRTGTYVSLSLGYELTGRAAWIRQVFVRWSDGDHPVKPTDNPAWMLGIVIGQEP